MSEKCRAETDKACGQLVTKSVTKTSADTIRLVPARPYGRWRNFQPDQGGTRQVRQDRL